ncbi:MAG: hypothetical protein ACRD2O_15230 [Terriglobia bacterium]
MSTRVVKEDTLLETVEWALAEAVEAAKSLQDGRENLRAHKRGSEAYWEALAAVAVAAEVLRAKLDTLVRATDTAEDGLPDD